MPAHEIERWCAAHPHLPMVRNRNQHGTFEVGGQALGRERKGKPRRVPGLRSRKSRSDPTPRQLRALELYASGLRYAQIAGAMGCSENTVKDHLLRARAHLGATTTAHAVAVAFRRGLLR